MGDFGNFLNGFSKSQRLIVLNIDWVQFVLKNEIPHSVRGLYDKMYCFTSDVMYKKYKRLVYTPSDLLARICKVNPSNAKKFRLICFPRICFRGLIYCTLGARDFSSAVSGFCQVYIVTRAKSLWSRALLLWWRRSNQLVQNLDTTADWLLTTAWGTLNLTDATIGWQE